MPTVGPDPRHPPPTGRARAGQAALKPSEIPSPHHASCEDGCRSVLRPLTPAVISARMAIQSLAVVLAQPRLFDVEPGQLLLIDDQVQGDDPSVRDCAAG